MHLSPSSLHVAPKPRMTQPEDINPIQFAELFFADVLKESVTAAANEGIAELRSHWLRIQVG